MPRAAVCVADHYEELELWYPALRLKEAGIELSLVGSDKNWTYHSKHGYPCTTTHSFQEMKEELIDAIVIPGGFAPDKLRRIPELLSLVQKMDQAQKPIAFICHGGWVPISAKILVEKRVTGTEAIKDDLENSGAIWVDEGLVIDGHLISSQTPKDLPLFAPAIIEAIR